MTASTSSILALATALLQLLQLLQSIGLELCQEALHRVIAHWCYYGVFIRARGLVGLDEMKGGVHTRVREKCAELFQDKKEGDNFSQDLKDLYDLRIRADYRHKEEFTLKDAEESIKLTSELIPTLNEARQAGLGRPAATSPPARPGSRKRPGPRARARSGARR